MLLKLDAVSLSFGSVSLLDNIHLQIDKGERLCLIGRNGEGKSTLLKVIQQYHDIDDGSIWRKPGLRIGILAQELPQDTDKTVLEYISEGLDDNLEVWHQEKNIDEVCKNLSLDPEAKLSSLSGGWQRRVALARALACEPELLLLDEPTNHLDINAIRWLENFLLQSKITLLFITHDRSLLQRIATRIIELDRGQLTSWPGDYQNYLRRREERLHSEEKANSEFDKKLAKEEIWIRQGIKARRTRNEGRVLALKKLRVERSQRRERQSNAKMAIIQGEQSGKIVIEADKVQHAYDCEVIINDFSLTLLRGDKIGLVGPNGIGKTTLIKLLLKEIDPSAGAVKHGSKLEVAYFDQLRQDLDPEQTVMDNVGEGRLSVTINGKQKHIISYLSDFLFSPERARTKIKAMSGGECNRLLLAKLFSKPFNLLVMDEPTNDLDIETLELLEELLCEFDGTLLLISHDRTFLNNVVNRILLFEGNGKVVEQFGDLPEQFSGAGVRTRTGVEASRGENVSVSSGKNEKDEPSSKAINSVGLTHQERKELNNLPGKIEKLESKKEQLQSKIAAPNFYQLDDLVRQPVLDQFNQVEQQLEIHYERWQELEGRK